MGNKKGVTLVFEQVMLFAISVTIFLILFSVFNIYQNFFLELNSDNQLDETKEWISSNILKVAEKETATTVQTILIPRYIGDAIYEISLTNKGLVIRNLITGLKKTSTLYSLNETFGLSGNITSIKGKVTIKKEANQIIIT